MTNKPREYPFQSYAWDDSPSNDNRWCDAVEVEEAYQALLEQAERMAETLAWVSNYSSGPPYDFCVDEIIEEAADALKSWQEFKK